MPSAKETLAGLFKGKESLAFWLWRIPALRERLWQKHSLLQALPWNIPRVDLHSLSPTSSALVLELDQDFHKIEALWKKEWLGKQVGGGQLPKGGDYAKVKHALELLAAIRWPNPFDGHDWIPSYRNAAAKLTGWSDIRLQALWKVYQVQELARFKDAQGDLLALNGAPAIEQELVQFGNPDRLLYESTLEYATVGDGRRAFDVLLEEAHWAGLASLLPTLYARAWDYKAEGDFPGMPSGWDAAWAKAQALRDAPSKLGMQSWCTDIARSVVKEHARQIPLFDETSVRPPYRVRYRPDWWNGNAWPAGWPSSKVTEGDGASEGLDVRKPLLQQNLDELGLELGDVLFVVAMSALGALFAGGLVSALLWETGASVEITGTLGDALGAGLDSGVQSTFGGLLGNDVDFGSAFLGAAGGSLVSNPMALSQDLGLGGVGDFFSDLSTFGKDVADSFGAFQDIFNPGKGGGGSAGVAKGDLASPTGMAQTSPQPKDTSWAPVLIGLGLLFFLTSRS